MKKQHMERPYSVRNDHPGITLRMTKLADYLNGEATKLEARRHSEIDSPSLIRGAIGLIQAGVLKNAEDVLPSLPKITPSVLTVMENFPEWCRREGLAHLFEKERHEEDVESDSDTTQ
jgi:hypothetical protein